MSNRITINGHEMFPTRYASAQDLKAKTYTLEIADVHLEKMTNPRTKQEQEKFVIYFKNAKRGFVLGKEFAESIAQALGEYDASAWAGKKIEIYTVQTRLGDGVRARRAPNGETPAPEVLNQDDEE